LGGKAFENKLISFKESDKNKIEFENEIILNDQTISLITYAQKISNGNIVVISIDVSEKLYLKKQNEEHQAWAINSSKLVELGEVAAGVAHEINNPLTIIDCANRIILKKAIKADGSCDIELIQKNAEKVDRMTKRIAKIVSCMQMVSRSDSFDPASNYFFEELLNGTLDLYMDKLNNFEINFSSKIEPGIVIYCQHIQILQVLMNLFSNAIDAIKNLDEKWIYFEIKTLDGMAEIKFIDSGNGIPEAIRTKIFQPFFTTKGIGNGTGLGLSISNGLIERNDGKMRIDGNHKNTCFVITIPLGKKQELLKVAA
jgi:C4-dicarboxylate-specific signal transduction histidine kinase